MLTITNISLFGTHGFSITNEFPGIHGRRLPFSYFYLSLPASEHLFWISLLDHIDE